MLLLAYSLNIIYIFLVSFSFVRSKSTFTFKSVDAIIKFFLTIFIFEVSITLIFGFCVWLLIISASFQDHHLSSAFFIVEQ
jgi:hypothetical protein